MERNPKNGQFMPGNQLSKWHAGNAKARDLVNVFTGLASNDLPEVYRLHLDLIRTCQDERVRLAAMELFYNRCLGKLTEHLAIQGGSSPLPALSADTLASLVRDLQAQAPVIDAAFSHAQSDTQSDKLSDEV